MYIVANSNRLLLTQQHTYNQLTVTWSSQLTVLLLQRRGSRSDRMPFSELYFNVDNGYLEGLVRGFKAGILSQADYLNLVQCETLEGE